MHFPINFKLFSSKEEIEIPSSIRIGEELISNLKPLGGIFKPGITKAGRISLTGNLKNGKKVKVYESFSEQQINLRKLIGEECKNKEVLFPKILGSDNRFIIEDWIKGVTFSNLKTDIVKKNTLKLSNFLEMLHNEKVFLKIARSNNNSFCYLNDYLYKRLKPWIQWLPVEKLIKRWLESEYEIRNILDNKISHPDLSLSNIILSDDGKIYIIDNELIGSGKGWLLDQNNSFFRETFKSYKLEPLIRNFFNLSWKLRLVGSAIDNGDFARAARMAKIENS